jgi:hypothetical protein
MSGSFIPRWLPRGHFTSAIIAKSGKAIVTFNGESLSARGNLIMDAEIDGNAAEGLNDIGSSPLENRGRNSPPTPSPTTPSLRHDELMLYPRTSRYRVLDSIVPRIRPFPKTLDTSAFISDAILHSIRTFTPMEFNDSFDISLMLRDRCQPSRCNFLNFSRRKPC